MRRFLKWLSLGLAVLCVVAFFVSLEYVAIAVVGKCQAYISGGCITLFAHREPLTASFQTLVAKTRLRWGVDAYTIGGRHFLHVPIWIPALAFLAAFAALHRPERRPKPGYCSSCEYDLTGNTSGVCAECGTAI